MYIVYFVVLLQLDYFVFILCLYVCSKFIESLFINKLIKRKRRLFEIVPC